MGDIQVWPTVNEPEQIVIDSEGEIRKSQDAGTGNTFKTELNLFEEDAQLIISEQTMTPQAWAPSLKHLPKQEMLVHVGGDPADKGNASISLFNDTPPFIRNQRITVPFHHYEYSLIVDDARPLQDQIKDQFKMVMAISREHNKPCQILRLTKVDETKWIHKI